MFEKLNAVEQHFNEVSERLMTPDVLSDQEQYKKLMREHKQLSPIIDKFHEYKAAKASFDEAKALLDEGGLDKDFKELAEEELSQARDDMARLGDELKVLLLPKDPNDERNVIVEIRGGAGGEEAALFAGTLKRMYTMYAEAHGFRTELISANETELGGFKEVSFMVEGEGAYSRLKFESGVHRVQRVPETETQGRIHTSTVTVAVLPEVDDVEVEINPADLQIDTYRSSGAGGQHINKTDSAIRIVHIPTGIVVGCQTERSQLQNKETALKMLKSKLMEIKEREKLDKIEDIQGVKANIEWGAQIRSYVFMPYTLAKDTRTGYENGNITAVMDGDIDGFINAYLKQNAASK